MKSATRMLFGAVLAIGGLSSGASAQTAEPTYKGDPDVYKLIYEDANFRVIEATRKAGVNDKLHGHPSPGIVYYLTDCTTKQYDPDGKTTERVGKAGTMNSVPVIAAHRAENTATTDCKQLFIEKK